MNASFRPAADIFSELNRLQNVLDQVFRDQDGQIIAVLDLVLPVGDDNAWCVLSVNGEVVTQNMGDGKPAICIWIRGAVPPLPPG